MFSVLVWVVLFYVTFYFELKKHDDDDLKQTLAMALQHLEKEQRTNAELLEIRNYLSQKYVILHLSLFIIFNVVLVISIFYIIPQMQGLKHNNCLVCMSRAVVLNNNKPIIFVKSLTNLKPLITNIF